MAFPGLSDPATAADVSPLLNAFETAAMVASPCPLVDAFSLRMATDSVSHKLLAALDSVCDRTMSPVHRHITDAIKGHAGQS